jgi:hypothetical protein
MYKRVVNVNRNAGIISSEVTATRALLGCGVAAGPLFLLTFVIQTEMISALGTILGGLRANLT